MVTDAESSAPGRVKERRVFLFEQLLIFSEPLDKKKGFSLPGFLYKNSIKVGGGRNCGFLVAFEASAVIQNVDLSYLLLQVNSLGLEDDAEGDPCEFVLTSRLTNGSAESFTLHSSHPGVREVWTLQIGQILESQRNFLKSEPKWKI